MKLEDDLLAWYRKTQDDLLGGYRKTQAIKCPHCKNNTGRTHCLDLDIVKVLKQ